MNRKNMMEALVLLRPSKNFQLPVHEHFEIEALLRESAAETKDIEAVRRFAAKHGITVARVNRRTRTLVLRGSAREISKIPRELDCVIGVFGLNNKPVSKRPGRISFPPEVSMTPPPVTANTRRPKDFRKLYEFPRNATGKGQCIAVLEFGGGFSRAKLRTYLQKLGVASPRIIVREIAPGGNRPLNRPGRLSPDAEVYMDLEILASGAPHATLVVFFAENSSRGWLGGVR